MIVKAQEEGIKVILLTPSPDLKDTKGELDEYAEQIRKIAKKYDLPLVDSYGAFMTMKSEKVDLEAYMSQNNHPNKKGHEVIAKLIVEQFKP